MRILGKPVTVRQLRFTRKELEAAKFSSAEQYLRPGKYILVARRHWGTLVDSTFLISNSFERMTSWLAQRPSIPDEKQSLLKT